MAFCVVRIAAAFRAFSALRWLYCSPPETFVCVLSLISGRLFEARRAHAGACFPSTQIMNVRFFSRSALGATMGFVEHTSRTRKGGNDLEAHLCGWSGGWCGGGAIALPNPGSGPLGQGSQLARAQSFSFGLFCLVCGPQLFVL